ncbi:MAG: hypothetical protein CM15mP40_13950 [Alphaproteobacteria bacterium]|nr:MAG: hypothetical protein CM15mP40_13950 [Alphaproteobacteria bacterium]
MAKDFLKQKVTFSFRCETLNGRRKKGLKDAWRLGVLHVEYKKTKRKYRMNSNERKKKTGRKNY